MIKQVIQSKTRNKNKTVYFLEDSADNNNIYWTKADTESLKKVEEKSKQKLKKLYVNAN